MQEHVFECTPVSIDVSGTNDGNLLAVGLLSGELRLHCFKNSELTLSKTSKDAGCLNDCLWSKMHKQAVRRVRFETCRDNSESVRGSCERLYTVSRNRAFIQWDVETGKKIRCLKSAHDSPPYSLCCVPHGSSSKLFMASGDDDGNIRLWDMSARDPKICKFQEQDDCITDLAVSSDCRSLLATSDDSTLASYNFRAKKLELRSEPMHSELLSLTLNLPETGGQVLCGGGDGFLEIFREKEYGNIVERVDSGHPDTVDCLTTVVPNLIASGSTVDGSIRLVHLNPNKNLGQIGSHTDGVQEICITPDKRWLVTSGYDDAVKFWQLRPYLKQVKSGRKQFKKAKKMRLKTEDDNFFDGLQDNQ